MLPLGRAAHPWNPLPKGVQHENSSGWGMLKTDQGLVYIDAVVCRVSHMYIIIIMILLSSQRRYTRVNNICVHYPWVICV